MAEAADNQIFSSSWQTFLANLKRNWVVYLAEWLLVIIVTTDYALDTSNIKHTLGGWFYVLPIAGMVLATLPFFKEWIFSRHKYAALAVAHLLVGLFMIFLASIFGPYFQVIILLLFASIFWFGAVGLTVSLTLDFLIVAIATWYQYGELNTSLAYVMALYLTTLVILGILFERISLKHRRSEADTNELLQTVSFERTRLLSLVNSMADAVLATDNKGKIVLYNGAALDLLNTNISLEGRYVGDFLSLHDETDKSLDIIGIAKKADTVLKRDDVYFVSNEGQKVRLYIDISPIRSGFLTDNDEGFIMLLRDITKEKSLDEERSEFISVTSHELRTPIAIAEANISTALLPSISEGIPTKAKDLLELAHSQIIFLGDLVNDLTTLARAERGDLQIEIEYIDPAEVVSQLVKNYQDEAKKRRLTLKSQSPAAKPKPIASSSLYVREILQNFVTNALKYTARGGVTIGVEPSKEGAVIFSVADTGLGISGTDKQKIFDKFYRAEQFQTRQTRGTGLGLYITLKLAERIGGRVWFDSKLNKGSTFYLEVPPFNEQRQTRARGVKRPLRALLPKRLVDKSTTPTHN